MLPFAATASTRLLTIILGAIILWTVLAALVALYGSDRGYRFWPLFIAALFLGFPLVLLAVEIADGPSRSARKLGEEQEKPPAPERCSMEPGAWDASHMRQPRGGEAAYVPGSQQTARVTRKGPASGLLDRD